MSTSTKTLIKKKHSSLPPSLALTLTKDCMMLVAPVFSKYGMILEPLWSCLSKGEVTVSCCFTSAPTRTAQKQHSTTKAWTRQNTPPALLRIVSAIAAAAAAATAVSSELLARRA